VECLQEDHTKLPALELAMRAATSVGAEVSISKQHSKARKALLTSDALQAVLLRAAERRDGAALRAAVLPLGIPFGEAVRHVRRKLTEAAEAPKAKKKNQNQSDPPVDLTALAAWAKELAISAEREEPCAPGDVADAFVAVVRKDLLKRADARSAKSKGVGLFGSTAAARGAAANNEPDMTAHVRKNCLDVLTGKSNHLVLPGCYLSKIPKEIARFDAANVVYLELTNNGAFPFLYRHRRVPRRWCVSSFYWHRHAPAVTLTPLRRPEETPRRAVPADPDALPSRRRQ